jgi:hypothetical protein
MTRLYRSFCGKKIDFAISVGNACMGNYVSTSLYRQDFIFEDVAGDATGNICEPGEF